MNSKLEEKLIQYEKSAQITNKQELLSAIKSILNEEESKKLSDQDVGLIDEAVEVVLMLNGVDTEDLSNEADIVADRIISEACNSDKTSLMKKSKTVRIKWLIPIAAIFALLISATFVASFSGYDVLSMTGRALKQLTEKIWYHGDNTSIMISSDARDYANFDEMIEKEPFQNLLWPSQVNDEDYIGRIIVTDLDVYTDITCSFNVHETVVEYSVVFFPRQLVREQEPIAIGAFDVYIIEYDNTYQADFVYMEKTYTITASMYECMEDFIKTLEEK